MDKTDFLFYIKLYQTFLTQNDQTDKKSSSNYIYEESRVIKDSQWHIDEKNV